METGECVKVDEIQQRNELYSNGEAQGLQSLGLRAIAIFDLVSI
jgi:hypothetical protein